MLLLKDLSEGKSVNKQETIDKLTHLKSSLSFLYFDYIKNEILKLDDFNSIDFDYFDYLIELFLNECLARDIDIRFIHKTIEWYKEHQFKTFDEYLNFFVNKVRISYDIYIPILNYKDINKDVFKQNDQTVINIDSGNYLHIYENGSIDFYRVITSHMIRIDSIFNTLKLYTSSEIGYDYKNDILIEVSSKTIEGVKQIYIPFSAIVKYKGVNPYTRFMNNSINNLNKLYEYDRDLYHKILNIIGYSEKNNDYINSSSYVDSWIALESLYSLNEVIPGYKSVKTLLPSFISSKIIVNKISNLLRVSFAKKEMTVERLIEIKDSELINACASIKSFYYKREVEKIKKRICNIKNLRNYYESVEKRISIDITRIYMLRNEYVHESKLSAFKSLQFYKLRDYLILSIDLFFNMLNQRIDFNQERKDIAFDVFAKLKDKNDLRKLFFIISTEKRKYRNNSEILIIKELDNDVSLSDAIMNIIFNNNAIVKKFVKYEK